MGHPHNRDKVRRIVAAVNSGRSRAEIAEAFGVTLSAVKTYLAHDGTLDARTYHGNEPRCRCGLLLPCTCEGGGLHAVDFMRSGDAAYLSASLGRFRDS